MRSITKILTFAGAMVALSVIGFAVWRVTARSRDEQAARRQTARAFDNLSRAGANPQDLRVALDLDSMAGKGYRLSDDEWSELERIVRASSRSNVDMTSAVLSLDALASDLKNSQGRVQRGFDLASSILDDPRTWHDESVDSGLLQVLLATRLSRSDPYFQKFDSDSRRNVRNIVLRFKKDRNGGKFN